MTFSFLWVLQNDSELPQYIRNRDFFVQNGRVYIKLNKEVRKNKYMQSRRLISFYCSFEQWADVHGIFRPRRVKKRNVFLKKAFPQKKGKLNFFLLNITFNKLCWVFRPRIGPLPPFPLYLTGEYMLKLFLFFSQCWEDLGWIWIHQLPLIISESRKVCYSLNLFQSYFCIN